MRYLCLIACFILVECQRLPAQEVNRTTQFIELDKPGKDEFPAQPMSFSGVRFFDNRIDTLSIGFVREAGVRYPDATGKYTKVGTVNVNGSLTDQFNNYVNTNFKRLFSVTSDSLLVVINYFRVSSKSEEFSDTDPQFVKLTLLFARKNSDRISILGEYDTLLAFNNRRSAQPYYAAPIRKSLKAALLKANSLMISAARPTAVLTENVFLQKYTGRWGNPVLPDGVLTKGAYANFQQALTNSPQYLHYDSAFTDVLTYDIIVKDTNGVRIGFNKIWGYCDGNTIYVFARHGGADVYPLIKKGNSLTISLRNADSAAGRTSARIVNGYMVIAAILTHGIAGSAVDDAIGPPLITVRAGRKAYQIPALGINMQTGEIDF